MDDLGKEIQSLLSLRKEGEHWDFKLLHGNPVDLVKDITCLANTVRYKGPRYLIFGVDPKSYEAVGISDTKSKTQADIIDTLRKAGFAEGQIPDIRLEKVDINGKYLDVIVISDLAHKPYFLENAYTNNRVTMRAGAVYSRTQDTNTPYDKTAPAHEIEKMWRERLGLSQTMLDRAKLYFTNPNDWQLTDGVYHHKNFPEFTIEEILDGERPDHTQEWTRGEIGAHYETGNAARFYAIKYHQTLIYKVHIVSFDGGKKSMVAPTWESIGGGRIYFYQRDSVEYAFQQFWSAHNSYEDDSIGIRKIHGAGRFNIPVFENEADLKLFMTNHAGIVYEEPIKDSQPEIQNQIFYNALDAYALYKKRS